jgi:cellulose synthase/poly-beta-1,6-N-acetylglucosamine synthase-like glycosyltransferase
MCNGANLLYKKEAFKAVDGFHGNDHLASGDDEFLMHKIALTGSITFIKNRDATVYTKPELTWESLLSQRIRWASKHKHYKNIITKMALLIIFLSNMGLLISILMFAFTFNSIYIIPLVIKYISDAIFLQSVYSFFKEKLPYFTLLLFIPMYPIYMLIVAYKANIGGKYQWKGRTQT